MPPRATKSVQGSCKRPREREKGRKGNGTSIHEEPGSTEDDGDDGDAGQDVLLVAAVQIAFHPRPEAACSTSTVGLCFARHFGYRFSSLLFPSFARSSRGFPVEAKLRSPPQEREKPTSSKYEVQADKRKRKGRVNLVKRKGERDKLSLNFGLTRDISFVLLIYLM